MHHLWPNISALKYSKPSNFSCSCCVLEQLRKAYVHLHSAIEQNIRNRPIKEDGETRNFIDDYIRAVKENSNMDDRSSQITQDFFQVLINAVRNVYPREYCFVTVVGSFQLKMLSVRQGTQHFTDENKVSRKWSDSVHLITS